MSDLNTNNGFKYYKDIWNSEKKVSSDPIVVPGMVYTMLVMLNSVFVEKGIRKLATLRGSGKAGYELLVKCPYCQAVHYQKILTKKYKCPHCYKKSTIVPFGGTFGECFLKRINNPNTDNEPWQK